MSSSIRIRPDQEILIKRLGINLSQFVKDKLDETYQDPERIREEIIELKSEIKSREELLKDIIKERTVLTKREIEYIKASKSLLDKYGQDSKFFINRCASYVTLFDKKFMTIEVFVNLVVST